MGMELRGPFGSLEKFRQFKLTREDDGVEAKKPVFVEMTRHADGGILALIHDLKAATVGLSAPGTDLPEVPPDRQLDDPAPVMAGAPGRFVSGRKTAHLTITYLDAEGRGVLRQGGTRAWRNNNPGNISRGSFAAAQGAIGDDGRFAVFPDEGTGFAAIIALLSTETYRALSLRDAIFRYAPPNENPSESYLHFISRRSGVAPEEVLHTLSAGKRQAVAEGIQVIEGWRPGAEIPIQPAPALLIMPDAESLTLPARDAEDWMEIARREAARPELERSTWPGPKANPRILEYFRVGAAWTELSEGDETDWCAAFVNYCLVKSGHIGTDHPGARSFFWNRKGQFLDLAQPRAGCIAVIRKAPFADPAWKTGKGHVGFVVSSTAESVTLLGGNQSRTVREQTYPMEERRGGQVVARVVAFRMPVRN